RPKNGSVTSITGQRWKSRVASRSRRYAPMPSRAQILFRQAPSLIRRALSISTFAWGWTSVTFDLDWVRLQLPGRRVDWHRTIGYTMSEAIRLAADGCASGTMVGAEEQTAGRGRLGRKWHSEPGAGVYVSVILRNLPA